MKVRGCSLFNILPKYIRNAENVTTNCFKKQLLKFLESVPDQPCLPHYYKSAVSNSIIDQMQVTRLDPTSHTTTDMQRTTATCSGPGLIVAKRSIYKLIRCKECDVEGVLACGSV